MCVRAFSRCESNKNESYKDCNILDCQVKLTQMYTVCDYKSTFLKVKVLMHTKPPPRYPT